MTHVTEMERRLEEASALAPQLTAEQHQQLLALGDAIVSILNRLGYRTGNSNTWTEKRVQHVRHTNGFPACPPSEQRLWITMQQAAATLGVSEMVVRRLIEQKILPAKQVVKFAPWMIERTHLELTAVRKEIRRVQLGRRLGWTVNEGQTAGLLLVEALGTRRQNSGPPAQIEGSIWPR